MDSRFDGIRRVIEAFERSDWSEIDVRSGDVHVHLVAGASDSTATPHAPASATTMGAPDPAAPNDADASDPPVASVSSAVSVPPGAYLVVSPSPGVFWRSPEPGAPPFAEVGDTIAASATVCIVEVMKLMNHIKAGIAGDVLAVYVENGVGVEKDAPLFAIAPNGVVS